MADELNYAYYLMLEERNVLPPEGLACDGTVAVFPEDPVCRANVAFTANGVLQPPQIIMNVPFQDAERMRLYFEYFVRDQTRQIAGG